MWLERFAGRVVSRAADPASPAPDAGDGLAAALSRSDALAPEALVDDVLAALPDPGSMSDAALARVALAFAALRTAAASAHENTARGESPAVDTVATLDRASDRLWHTLAERCAGADAGRPAAIAAMCAADALLRRGDEPAAMAHLAAALDHDPGLWPDVRAALGAGALARARRAGPAVALPFALAELAARLPDTDAVRDAGAVPAARPPGNPDDVRERYSELLDDYRDDPAATERIRALGRRIAALEAAGALPRVLVRRTPRRRD